MKHYIDFCQQFNWAPFPVRESNIIVWCGSLVERGLKYTTVISYISAIKCGAALMGYAIDNYDSMYHLRYMLRAIRKHCNPDPPPRLPITFSILYAIKPHIPHTFDGMLHWAAMTMAVTGLLRCGEFTTKTSNAIPTLLLSHIRQCPNVDGYYVTLQRDKTSYGKPRDIFLPRTSTAVCAVDAVAKYLHHRYGIMPQLYRPASPLLSNRDGTALTRTQLIAALHQYAQAAHLPNWEMYKGHSFRRGGATSLAAAQVQDSVIRNIGRWRSYSSSQLYIETTSTDIATVIKHAMVQCADTPPSVFMGLNYNVNTCNAWELSDTDVNQVSQLYNAIKCNQYSSV